MRNWSSLSVALLLRQYGEEGARGLGGFHLFLGDEVTLDAPLGWSGHVWTRRGCSSMPMAVTPASSGTAAARSATRAASGCYVARCQADLNLCCSSALEVRYWEAERQWTPCHHGWSNGAVSHWGERWKGGRRSFTLTSGPHCAKQFIKEFYWLIAMY